MQFHELLFERVLWVWMYFRLLIDIYRYASRVTRLLHKANALIIDIDVRMSVYTNIFIHITFVWRLTDRSVLVFRTTLSLACVSVCNEACYIFHIISIWHSIERKWCVACSTHKISFCFAFMGISISDSFMHRHHA